MRKCVSVPWMASTEMTNYELSNHGRGVFVDDVAVRGSGCPEVGRFEEGTKSILGMVYTRNGFIPICVIRYLWFGK